MPTKNVKYFNQETDRRLAGGAGKGVCLPMCAYYLIHRAKGNDYWEWFEEMAQLVRDRGQTTVRPENYFPDIEAVGGLQRNERLVGETSDMGNLLLQGARGPFRLAIMDNQAFGSAHAIACHMGLKIRILDVSGGGEFEFDTREEAFGWISLHVKQPRVRAFGAMVSYAEAFRSLTVFGFKPKP